MHDKEIIKLFFDRDEDALKETEQKYSRLCFGIARNILENDHDAEECVNDTLLALWNRIPPMLPLNFKAFVAKFARNISLKRLEYNLAEKRRADDPIPLHELDEVISEDRLEAYSENDLRDLINEFLLSEKEPSRNVFLRRYWFFDQISDIAKRYSYSESKVKSMLFQTRNRLKEFLISKGVEL